MSEIPAIPQIPDDNSAAAEKVRSFPHTPGVYLMKDAAGRVIYIGKAKDLRSRAGSYFLKAATEDPRTMRLVEEIRDIDYLDAESEVDALLMEARLIKDLLPKFNRDLRDDKTFPYLEIHTYEDYPRVEVTRTPKERGVKLYGPFANSRSLRAALQVLQKIFQFRTCSLDIRQDEPRWRWFRPCLLAAIGQCAAPCNFRISREEYRKNIHRLQQFLEGKKQSLLGELRADMAAASTAMHFEEAARLRDEIHLLETLNERGRLDTHVQPEVFPVDPKKGLAGLQKVLRLPSGRDRSRASTSPIPAAPTRWPASCSSSTVCPSSRATSGCGSAASRGSTTWPASTRPWCGASTAWPRARSCPTSS